MHISPVVACGLFFALLALGLEAKPAPPHTLQKSPSGSAAARLGRDLADLLEASSGPAAGAGRGAGGRTKQQGTTAAGTGSASSGPPQQHRGTKGASATSRLMRELRPTEPKLQARQPWTRMLHPEHRAAPGGGGGGGGGAGLRRFKGLIKKGLAKGCFGLKLDRIGSMSGLGC